MSEQLTLAGTIRPTVLAVGGCSGSGKTTLARELARELKATLFPLDLYYRDLSHLPLEQRHTQNFDHPDSLESELILQHLEKLSRGEAIDRPRYDFSTHSRMRGLTDRVEACPFILVEGILALHYPELQPLYDLTVFVDAPYEVCLNRRIYRDERERGRTAESVRAQFDATAWPMAERFVLPAKEHTSLMVSGCESLDWSVEAVLGTLRRRGLL